MGFDAEAKGERTEEKADEDEEVEESSEGAGIGG